MMITGHSSIGGDFHLFSILTGLRLKSWKHMYYVVCYCFFVVLKFLLCDSGDETNSLSKKCSEGG